MTTQLKSHMRDPFGARFATSKAALSQLADSGRRKNNVAAFCLWLYAQPGGANSAMIQGYNYKPTVNPVRDSGDSDSIITRGHWVDRDQDIATSAWAKGRSDKTPRQQYQAVLCLQAIMPGHVVPFYWANDKSVVVADDQDAAKAGDTRLMLVSDLRTWITDNRPALG